MLQAFFGQDAVKGLGAFVEEIGIADAHEVESVAVILEGAQLGTDLRGILRADGQRADVVEGRRVQLRCGQSVAAAHRKTGDGAGRGLGDDAETLLDERDDFGDKALDIGVGVGRIAGVDVGGAETC